jgi:hypothetical protein
MLKAEVLESVQKSVSSIFSKEDVVMLINSIEAEKTASTKKFSDKFKDDLNNAIDQRIDNLNDGDIIDSGSFEFDINNGNEISVCEYGVDKRYILDEIWDEVVDFLDNYEEEESATEETEETEEA